MSSEDLPLAVPAYLAISSDGIIEGVTNLFYTDSRSRAAISLTGSPSFMSYNSTTGIINVSLNFNQNLLTTSSPTFNGLTVGSLNGVLKASAGVISGNSTTTDLSEGVNMYYTTARFDAALASKSTADLSESPGFLYFTDLRAQNAISLTGSPSFMSYIGGVINISYDYNQNLLTTSSPTFNALTLTTALPVSSGGTGQSTYTDGQLLIGNSTGNTLTKATLTGSSNITITNGAGSITIDTSTSASPSFSTLTLTGAVGSNGQLYLNNGTSNYISMNANGSGAPTFTTRSAGTKLVLNPALSGAAVDYALGIDTNVLWYSVPTTSQSHLWYAGTTNIATLTGAGALSCSTLTLTGSANQITLNNGTSNMIYWNNVGVATPTYTTRSAGTKLVIFPGLGASSVDYALGMATNLMWFSVPTTSQYFSWYTGTTSVAILSNTALNLGSTGGNGIPMYLILTANAGNESNAIVFKRTANAAEHYMKFGIHSTYANYISFNLNNGSTNVTSVIISPYGITCGTSITIDNSAALRVYGYQSFGNTFTAAIPAVTTRSTGTCVVIRDSLSGSAVDYAIGYETNAMWLSVATTSQSFKWYAGTTVIATLTGAGALDINGTITCNTSLTIDAVSIGATALEFCNDLDQQLTTTSTPTFSTLTINGSAPNLLFANGTSNMINFGTNGSAAPSKAARSAGTRLILYNSFSAGVSTDHAMGIEGLATWLGVPTSSHNYYWYADETRIMTLAGTGALSCATLTVNGTAPNITLSNGTSNMINFGTPGINAPTLTTRSAGTKLILYNGLSGSSVDHAIGMAASTLWFSIPTADSFKWYADTTIIATLTGAGALDINGTITCNTSLTIDAVSIGATALEFCNDINQQLTTTSSVVFGAVDITGSGSTTLDIITTSTNNVNINMTTTNYQYQIYCDGTNNALAFYGNTRGLMGYFNGAGSAFVLNPGITLHAFGDIYMANGTSNLIYYNTPGIAAPTFTSRSAGTKIVFYGSLSGSDVDYAIGMGASNLWFSVQNSAASYYWYAATTIIMTLTGAGALSCATLTLTGAVGSNGQLYLNNGTSNYITMNANGSGAPTFTTRSAGTKLVLNPALGGATVDYALGIDSTTLWHSVRNSAASYAWYAGTTQIMSLTGAGALTVNAFYILGGEMLTSGNVTLDNGFLTISGAVGTYGQIYLSNGTSNRIYFTSAGLAAPTFTTRSAGVKLVLYPALSGSAADYAIGINTNVLWYGVPTTSQSHLWYAGTTNIATLSGAGVLTTAAGHVLTTGGITLSQANQTITGSTGLTLQQTGDTYGTTRLYLQNRVGVNGAMFEQAGSVDLVDFVFKGLANQRNIRYENRGSGSGSFVLAPEFQIGSAGTMNCVIADTILAIKHEFRIYSSTSSTNYIAFRCNTASGNYTLTYPAATGSANQFLYTNGSGVLAWTGLSASDANNNLTYSPFTYTLTSTPTFSTLTINGSAPNLTFSNATSNMINFGTNGAGAPSTAARSPGTRIILYDEFKAGVSTDHAIGIGSYTVWFGVPTTSHNYRWYVGETNIATLTGLGAFSITGGLSCTTIAGTTLTLTGAAPNLFLSNATSNMIKFANTTNAAPTFTSRSAGTKIIMYDTLSGSNVDYAIGLEGNGFWCSVNDSTASYYWYAATTRIMTLAGTGALDVNGTVTCNTSLTIDAVSIGATALDYCNDINQQLTTTSLPTFSGIIASSSGYTGIESKTTGAGLNAYYIWTTPSYGYQMYADGTFDALVFFRTTGGGSILGYFSGTSSLVLNVSFNPYAGINMSNVTSNLIQFNTAGVAAPTFTSRSAGTKICLYNSLSGSTVDYALGINGATFWYSISDATNAYYFKWYAATTVVLTLNGAGDLTTTGNIIMPTTGGTAANLNYYEEYTANLSFSGTPFTGSQDVAVKINRIGKAITFTLNALTVAASGSAASYTTAASAVPSRLVPAYTLSIPIRVLDNSASKLGLLLIQTNGTVTVYFGINGTDTNTNSGNCGHHAMSVSYCL